MTPEEMTEVRELFALINARLDHIIYRLDRIDRLTEWAGKIDGSLAGVLRRQAEMEQRLRRLERGISKSKLTPEERSEKAKV